MTIEALEPSALSRAPREGGLPSVRSERELLEPSAPYIRRPLEVTLVVLNDLAASLAREGIEIRGAFARVHKTRAPAKRRTLKKPPVNGKDFIGHFSIPTTDNHGNPFPASLLLSILSRLYKGMGGASFRETVGLWRDKGSCYLDLLIAVEVWTGDRERLVALVRWVCKKLGQQCIPLRIERAEFVWIEGPGEAVP